MPARYRHPSRRPAGAPIQTSSGRGYARQKSGHMLTVEVSGGVQHDASTVGASGEGGIGPDRHRGLVALTGTTVPVTVCPSTVGQTGVHASVIARPIGGATFAVGKPLRAPPSPRTTTPSTRCGRLELPQPPPCRRRPRRTGCEWRRASRCRCCGARTTTSFLPRTRTARQPDCNVSTLPAAFLPEVRFSPTTTSTM